MNVHATPPPPDPHRPLTPGDKATALPVVAEASSAQAEMLIRIKDSDSLAELAGVNPEQLKRIKEQEWPHGSD